MRLIRTTQVETAPSRSRRTALIALPSLALVPATAAPVATADRRPSLLAMWHLLSLDAPTVAALWVWCIARSSGVALSWISIAAMFVAVWMLYAADRLLDARPLRGGKAAPELEDRHRFHHRHRHAFVVGIACASVVLAMMLTALDPNALRLYTVLASLLVGYFCLIHLVPASEAAAHRLPKELAVGLFFAAATFIPTVAHMPALRPVLLPSALLFAATCTLNCLYLYAWEHPDLRAPAHWTTRTAVHHLCLLSNIAIFAAFAMAMYEHATVHAALYLPALVCGFSVVLLRLLHTQRDRLSAIHLRAAADLVLLTPIVVFPLLQLLPR